MGEAVSVQFINNLSQQIELVMCESGPKGQPNPPPKVLAYLSTGYIRFFFFETDL